MKVEEEKNLLVLGIAIVLSFLVFCCAISGVLAGIFFGVKALLGLL